MFTKKNKYIWIINLVIFVFTALLGIEQGTIGAKISKQSQTMEVQDNFNREISEQIFKGQEIKDEVKIMELGYIKPSNIVYFDTENLVAKLPVR